jgi:DNA-binding response OmpR family regulator
VTETPHHTSASDFAARPLGGSRVVVLDSDADGAASLAGMLRLSGFDAVVAHSAREAVRLVAATRPCAVLTDLDLPDGDPLRLIRQLRATPGGPVVVVVTGDTDPARRAAVTAAGAVDFFLKPADPQTLVRRLQHLCHPG